MDIRRASLAGHNLPAALVRAHSGLAPVEAKREPVSEFVRIVVEVPRRPAAPCEIGDAGALLHPSGMPELTRILGAPGTEERAVAGDVIVLSGVDLSPEALRETPARVMLKDAAERRFVAAADAARARGHGPRVVVSYSVKTNPDETLVRLAVRSRMAADVISQDEAAWAHECGFSPSTLTLNGPAKLWPRLRLPSPAGMLFADSLEELRELRRRDDLGRIALTVGVRLRPGTVRSRFGVPIRSAADRTELVNALRAMPRGEMLALHFHIAAAAVGTGDWYEIFNAFLEVAADLERRTRRRIATLDVGGGWTPKQWDEVASHGFERIVRPAARFPELQQLVVEPGKALVQESMVVACTVLQVIRDADTLPCEVVVDGSIAELPVLYWHPHRIGRLVSGTSNRVKVFSRGGGRVLGRLCMEADVLAEDAAIPADVAPGDRLVILDAGAYDASMSYSFGRGAELANAHAGPSEIAI